MTRLDSRRWCPKDPKISRETNIRRGGCVRGYMCDTRTRAHLEAATPMLEHVLALTAPLSRPVVTHERSRVTLAVDVARSSLVLQAEFARRLIRGVLSPARSRVSRLLSAREKERGRGTWPAVHPTTHSDCARSLTRKSKSKAVLCCSI